MKRYIIAGMPGGMAGSDEDECGNWVKYEEAADEIDRLEASLMRHRYALHHIRQLIKIYRDGEPEGGPSASRTVREIAAVLGVVGVVK